MTGPRLPSRRRFLLGTAGAGGALALGLVWPRPRAARAARADATPGLLSPAEWRAADTALARILPSEKGPGAREAGCVNFLDKSLLHEDAHLAPLVRAGLAGLDAVAAARHPGAVFAALPPPEQDAVLAGLARGELPGWPAEPPPRAFFEVLRLEALLGFLCDPRHGGNRGFAGWRRVGYPGPSHPAGGYTPEQMLGRAPIRPVWERAGRGGPAAPGGAPEAGRPPGHGEGPGAGTTRPTERGREAP